MIRGLLRKEWREHRLALGAYVGGLGALLLVQRWSEAARSASGSPFEIVRAQCYFAALLGSFFVSHRLLVREYGQKTQLFLETLPITRARLLAFKLVLGAAVLLLPIAVALALAARDARAHELLTLRSLALISARAALPVLAGWSLLALAGVVGRYRNPLFLFVLFGAMILDTSTSFKVAKLGPALLLGDDFAYTRQYLPLRGVLLCLALTAAFGALSFALVLYRDGTLAELLSDRMSHREKVFIACALTGLIYLGLVFGREKAKEPFRLHEGTSARERGVTVQVAPAGDFPPGRADDLGRQVALDVAELSGYLALPEVPAIALLPTRELDADVFERAQLTDADGLVLRANFGDEGFDARRFRAFLARELVTWASNGHALREERRWLRDGFAVLWANRDGAETDRLERRAGYAAGRFSPARAPEWLTVEEELGPCLADAVAWLGVRAVRERLGEDGFRELIRATLSGRPPKGVLGLIRTGSIRAALGERGLPWPGLLAAWSRALEDARGRQAGALAGARRLSATLWLDRDSGATFSVRHALAVEPPPGGPLRYTFLARRVGPFDAEVPPRDFERFSAAAGGPVRVPRSFARGERWLWAVEVSEPALGCAVRVHAERREIR